MANPAPPPAEIPVFDLSGVERRQAELLELVGQLEREPDQERQAELVRRIGEHTDELQRVCGELEAKARAAARDMRGTFEVVLTPAQRDQIRAETGVDMATLTISDDSGGMMAAMPTMQQEQVMRLALEEARQRKRRREARVEAERELERIRDELKDAPEQVRMEVERMLGDPEFKRAFEDPK